MPAAPVAHAEDLADFVDASPSSYHAAAETARRLEAADAVFLPSDKEYYEQVSDEVMRLLRDLGLHSVVAVPLTGPEGTAVTPKAGLPTVAETGGKPVVTVPKTDPPKDLVVQPLIEGTGELKVVSPEEYAEAEVFFG